MKRWEGIGVDATRWKALYDECAEKEKAATHAAAAAATASNPFKVKAAAWPMILDFHTTSSFSKSTSSKRNLTSIVVPMRVVRALVEVLGEDTVSRFLFMDENNYDPMDDSISSSNNDTDAETPTATSASSSVVPPRGQEQEQERRLVFSSPPAIVVPREQQQHEQFQLRLQRLAQQQEHDQYRSITRNVLGSKWDENDDHVTTRSMTYAASIGLNMIVAPLSFGAFMAYFAGPVLDFIGPTISTTTTSSSVSTTDIRRVMIGVLSGVGLMIVEMLLFVIRTHALDEAMMKKKKNRPSKSKNKTKVRSAFGHYSSSTEKSYTDGQNQ